MASRVKKPNGGLLIAAIVAALVVIINFQHLKRFAYKISSDFFYPFLEAPSNAAKKISGAHLMSKTKEELATTADRYKRANDQLLAELASIEDLKSENEMLRSLLTIPERAQYNYVFAELLTRDPAFWDEKFTINKGREDGIIPGSPVLSRTILEGSEKSQLAIIGRVRDVTNHTAVISTIFSQDCKLSVELPHSGVTGVINGGGRKGAQLWANIKYLPRDILYKATEPVFTSGASQWTPSSLYVGKLSGERSAKVKIQNNLFVEAQMTPEADIGDVKFVMVMVKNH